MKNNTNKLNFLTTVTDSLLDNALQSIMCHVAYANVPLSSSPSHIWILSQYRNKEILMAEGVPSLALAAVQSATT